MIEANQSKSEFWLRHLTAAKEYSGSKQKYCDVHGLKVATFYQWKRKLEGETRPRKRPVFLPAIVEERCPEIQMGPLPDARWVAEVMAHLMAVVR